jgi:hypothetical protein
MHSFWCAAMNPPKPVGPGVPSGVTQLRNRLSFRTKRPPVLARIVRVVMLHAVELRAPCMLLPVRARARRRGIATSFLRPLLFLIRSLLACGITSYPSRCLSAVIATGSLAGNVAPSASSSSHSRCLRTDCSGREPAGFPSPTIFHLLPIATNRYVAGLHVPMCWTCSRPSDVMLSTPRCNMVFTSSRLK